MHKTSSPRRRPCGRSRSGATVAALLVSTLVTLVPVTAALLFDWFRPPAPKVITAAVILSELPVAVTARGTIESQLSTKVTCDVWSLGQNDGTQIQYLIPDGTAVKKGELLVKLNVSVVQERLEDLELSQIRAKARQIQADARLKSQKFINLTRVAEVRQAGELAHLELEAYQDGTSQLQDQLLESRISEARRRVTLAESGLELKRNAIQGINDLHALQYRTSADVQRASPDVERSAHELQSAKNSLQNALAELHKFDQFEHPLALKKLEFDLLTTDLKLRQVTMDNVFQLAEREANKQELDQTVANYDERIEDYSNQVDNCQIYAPHDGMVVYESDRRGNTVRQGRSVRWRQTILTLPDMSTMQVKTKVGETEYRHLQPGLPATVQAAAFPESAYTGTVQSVAAVSSSSSYLQPNVQVFEVIISIDEFVDHLQPGMTGVVNIQIERDEPVLQVPVEAILEVDEEMFALVDTPDGPQRRAVIIGDSNEEMVEVFDGLELGERVILSPDLL